MQFILQVRQMTLARGIEMILQLLQLHVISIHVDDSDTCIYADFDLKNWHIEVYWVEVLDLICLMYDLIDLLDIW